jgi:hypothetical protein
MNAPSQRREASVRSVIDRALLAALTRGWDSAAIADYSNKMERRSASTPTHIENAFQTLDIKATGLLTHTSMMIAGLGIVAPLVAQNAVEEAIVIFQIAIYLLIAVGCLRCLSVFGPRETDHAEADPSHHVGRELMLRQELYRVCNTFATAFSLFVFITLVALLFWSPGR